MSTLHPTVYYPFMGIDIPLHLTVEYSPPQAATYWEPGCDAEAIVTAAEWGDKQIVMDDLTDDERERLDELVEAWMQRRGEP